MPKYLPLIDALLMPLTAAERLKAAGFDLDELRALILGGAV